VCRLSRRTQTRAVPCGYWFNSGRAPRRGSGRSR